VNEQRSGARRLVLLTLFLVLSIGALAVPLLLMTSQGETPSGETSPTEALPLPGPESGSSGPVNPSLLIIVGVVVLFGLFTAAALSLRFLMRRKAEMEELTEAMRSRARTMVLTVGLALAALVVAILVLLFALTP
jgi:hypothetical protein